MQNIVNNHYKNQQRENKGNGNVAIDFESHNAFSICLVR